VIKIAIAGKWQVKTTSLQALCIIGFLDWPLVISMNSYNSNKKCFSQTQAAAAKGLDLRQLRLMQIPEGFICIFY
jgi:hypothetical protein